MDIQELIEMAVALAECGQFDEAAKVYQTIFNAIEALQGSKDSLALDQLTRSLAFNYAQVLNKLGRFREALDAAELGLARSPTSYGRAIGLAAKGEAHGGLRDVEASQAAFEHAAAAQPVVGRLNSADSMTRLGPDWLEQAEEWLEIVKTSFQDLLDSKLRAEAGTIAGKIAAARGNYDSARNSFESVLRQYPNYEDAKLQLRSLTSRKPAEEPIRRP